MTDAPTAIDGRCSCCGSSSVRLLLEARGVPAHVCSYWDTREEALASPRGDLVLQFCHSCGFIENVAFDEDVAEYSGAYENSLQCSEFFQGYIHDLAAQILERHGAARGVLEIGCGDGEFLKSICELAGTQGVGFDPAYPAGAPETALDGGVRFVRDYYRPAEPVEAGLVVCRQALEHIPQPGAFLAALRPSLRPETAVVFEVPDFQHALERHALWDIVYEHCNYFSPATLAQLFARNGYDVLGTWSTYADQFVAIDARPAAGPTGRIPGQLADASRLEGLARDFSSEYSSRIRAWSARLEDWSRSGSKVVVWGAGARGVNFLNLADRARTIEYAVDINARKQGRHVVGTGQEVVPPDFLDDYRPDVVLVMNSIYLPEIRQELAQRGLEPALEPA